MPEYLVVCNNHRETFTDSGMARKAYIRYVTYAKIDHSPYYKHWVTLYRKDSDGYWVVILSE